jgi:hypothetical protein
VSDDVTLSCPRYTRAPDGKGLIALQYDERFKLGQVDGDDVKALRKRAIDAMAKFDMSEVKAWRARKVSATSFRCYGHRGLAHRVIAVGRRARYAGGRRRWRLRWPRGRGGLGGSIGQPVSGYGRPGGGVRPNHPTPAGPRAHLSHC